jgi:hypothetical protein
VCPCVSVTVCPELTVGSFCPLQFWAWVNAPYPGGQLHAIVEIPKPEEVGKAVGDVEGTQLLVSQSQKPQNVHVVLVSPNSREKQPFCTGSLALPLTMAGSQRGM